MWQKPVGKLQKFLQKGILHKLLMMKYFRTIYRNSPEVFVTGKAHGATVTEVGIGPLPLMSKIRRKSKALKG